MADKQDKQDPGAASAEAAEAAEAAPQGAATPIIGVLSAVQPIGVAPASNQLDVTEPGGRYIVDGRAVNANGDPIPAGKKAGA